MTGKRSYRGFFTNLGHLGEKDLNKEHFLCAIKEAIPSVTEEMEREYQNLARKVKQQSMRIGFAR